jgi:hypothetical protein
MTDEITELKAQLADALKRVAALEERANPPRQREVAARLGMEPPFSPSTYAAIDRACVPREITDGMAKNVGTEMVQEIVRTTKAPR